jgi:FtsZ-interacting cell division protein ZipA
MQMSDLQIVLIIIGGVIIAAVLVFNWWQERRFHQQVEASFSDMNNSAITNDALLEHSLPDEALPAEHAQQTASADTNDTYPAEVELDHDNFSIDHDSINDISISREEPHIAIADTLAGDPSNTDSEAMPAMVVENQGIVRSKEFGSSDFASTDFVSAPADFDHPFANDKPTNHEGIRAIFEGVFNKAESADNTDEVHEEQDSNANTRVVEVATDVSAAEPLASLPAMLHAQVDLIASLHLAAHLTMDATVAALTNVFDAFDKPTFVHVQTTDMHWLLMSDAVHTPEFANQKVSKITCSLQLADRAGPVSRSIINRFQLAVETLGMDINAHVEWLHVGDAAADAVALDAFCIDVDKTMGFHLVHGENGAFTGTKLRGLAEAQGLELSSEGTFKYYDEAAKKQLAASSNPPVASFVMFNRDHYPFNPDMLRSSVVKAITFQLDIPHVQNCTEAFNHMVQVAKQMEIGLHAQLVDDNNRPLGDVQIEKIRHQLKVIQATMLTRGITPGSDCARRLFS